MARLRSCSALLATLLSGCGGCSDGADALRAEEQRLWGREKLADAVAAQAEEAIDAEALATDVEARERVRTMGFREVVARLGFVRYEGRARFTLERGGETIEVFEDTAIEHGLHGGWRVVQRDEDGALLREKVLANGLHYVRNGPGALRAQGVADAPGSSTLDQAFSPFAAFTGWYGSRLALRPAGGDLVRGRAAVRYRLGLGPGPELIQDPSRPDKRLRPLELSGEVLIDADTAAPLEGRLRGTLEVQPPPGGSDWGELALELDFRLIPTEGRPILVDDHVPEIVHRPVDLDPLGFLEGKTRTSTVIRGLPGGGDRP